MSAETRAVQLFTLLEKERSTTRALKEQLAAQQMLVRRSWADGFFTGLGVILMPILIAAALVAWIV